MCYYNVFAFFVFDGANLSKCEIPGAYIRMEDLADSILCYELEGLSFGILQYASSNSGQAAKRESPLMEPTPSVCYG